VRSRIHDKGSGSLKRNNRRLYTNMLKASLKTSKTPKTLYKDKKDRLGEKSASAQEHYSYEVETVHLIKERHEWE
jgi:hypothetical protein